MIEAVIFDYGGVLATSQWAAFADLEKRIGVDAGGLVPYFGMEHPDRPGTPAWQVCEIGELAWSEFATWVVERASAAGIRLLDVDDLSSLMPLGALWPMVHRARRLKDDGYKLAILTNNVREFGPYWRSTVPVDMFDVVVDSCEEGVRKPNPEIYLRTAERLMVEPTACAFLDDGAENCEAAASVGMKTVLVGTDINAAIAALDALL